MNRLRRDRVKENLLGVSKYTGGRSLLIGLDELGVNIDTAFWLLDEEIAEWRLILATGLIRTTVHASYIARSIDY